MHPAVFVDIVGNDIVRVVMISNNFKTRIVPPHLRGPASYYFHTEPEDSESNVPEESALAGELDLSMFGKVERSKINIGHIAAKTIMAQPFFEEMNNTIRFNEEDMGNRIMPLHFEPPNNSKESKDESKDDPKDEFDYIEEGQILLVARWLGEAKKYSDETSPGIFVSWIGNGMLAIVQVSEKVDRPDSDKANIHTYIKQGNKVIDSSGKSTPIDGEISLVNYKFMFYKGIRFSHKKITMERESYTRLRETIDRNIKERRKDPARGNDGVPESGTGALMGGGVDTSTGHGAKEAGSRILSSTTTTSASSKETEARSSH